jgi:fructose-bisphosphate aldolase, class II
MPTVPTRDLVTAAAADGVGVAAFNVITLEHAEAIVAGIERARRPAILQISENAIGFHGGRVAALAAAVRSVIDESTAAAALHLDHVTSFDLLGLAATHGFGSVMFDASRLPYAENVTATRAAADLVHAQGLWLESELGVVGGKDGADALSAHAPGARTDPDQARSYVEATGVDGLAVAVGSVHAMTTRDATLDHELIAALHRAVPRPLVLHGSSGVPDAELRAAVRGGVTKVNIGTALNVAFTGAVRAALDADAAVVDPRRYLASARDAMADTVAHFIGVLADA